MESQGEGETEMKDKRTHSREKYKEMKNEIKGKDADIILGQD